MHIHDAILFEPHAEPQIDRTLLVIVGSSLAAEAHDRPLAYSLARAVSRWQQASFDDGELDLDEGLAPVLCTDLWYLNQRELLARPAIAVGHPEANAATAMLASRLPEALTIDGSLRIHLDPELLDQRVCVWGADDEATRAAVTLLIDRHLDRYLRALHHLREAE